MTRTDLPAAYVDRLAELAHLHRREAVKATGAPQDLLWNIPGIKTGINKVQDTGACALDIDCVVLSAADDLSIRTPGLMAESGKHWTHTTTGQPAYRECRHGKRIATNVAKDETDSAVCQQCDEERLTRSNIPNWRAQYQAEKAIHAPATRKALTGKETQ